VAFAFQSGNSLPWNGLPGTKIRKTVTGLSCLQILPLLLGMLSTAGSVAAAQGGSAIDRSFPQPGEWTSYRRTGRLDAHSPLHGEITQPHVLWKQFVGTLDSWFVLTPGARHHTSQAALNTSTSLSAIPTTLPGWGLQAPVIVDGVPQPITQNCTTTYAHVLPDHPGYQKLEFESAFARPTTNGDWAHDCVGRCFAWENGAWKLIWQSDPIDALFAPQPIVGDFDADGSPEVAILPWKELLILDARTGKVKDRCHFTDGRSYGFFGTYDLDGDGKSEFVVQADFAKHVDVLGYRNGKLSLLWRKEIETDISNPQKILRVPPEPVGDVDGDGKREVMESVFNATGDNRWHLLVHDGITGVMKADLPDEYLRAVVDLNGDGAASLLTTHASGAGVPECGTLHAWTLQDGQPHALWQGEGMAWQTWNPPLPMHVNSGATVADQDVMWRRVEGRAWVVLRQQVRNRPGEVRLTTERWNGDHFELVSAVQGRHLEAMGMDARDGKVLVRTSCLQNQSLSVVSDYGTIAPLGTTSRGVPTVGVAVAQESASGRSIVIAPGPIGSEELVAFRVPGKGHRAQELWRVAGRGQGVNWPQGQMYGPVVADLSGDGRRQHLYATSAPSGCARLMATTLTNQPIWHHDFPTIPGTPPIWNTGGLVMWTTGHFRDKRTQDVLVTVRRSMMHSEETCLLSGHDGKEIWRRNRQIDNRGVGGTPFAIADYDGDGLDDVACLHPSEFYLLNGATGKDILAKPATWDGVPAKPVYWGIPIAGDFDGSGKASLLFGTTNRSMIGRVRTDGTLAWWDALDAATTCLPAIGNFTGHGHTEIVGLGFKDGMHCYDAMRGKLLWSMPSPTDQTAGELVSADINSDGRDEVLMTAGTTLYCIGSSPDGTQGTLLWKLDLHTWLGPPVIADTEGDGRASILMVGADGNVYCVR
jgi:outer membrane protein assembly factor BamB